MLIVDKIRKPQSTIFYIVDYLWSGFATLAIVCFFLSLWQWASISVGEFLLPSPITVFHKAIELLSDIQHNQIELSLWRAFVGVGGALLLGLSSGFISGYFRTVLTIFKPVITILLATPPIIWVVMALFWFGFGNLSVLFTIWIIVTPLTFASAAIAVQQLNKQTIEVFDVYQVGIWKKLKYLYIPHFTSYAISSISVAVATGIRVVVMAELLGASDGIGARIADARAMLDTETVMAYVVLVITLVALFEYCISKPIEILFMPWKQ
ncbi:ABC transporter permease [Gallibacterium salpingitidis]|uniref:ABC transporter permease n=1 Tax=Gallibacterium salpingitidis TaxID=505341 RepID=A0AB36E5P7_9PAST|nr:ABC transporter permease subunit [Gallibacterium salpingitidis]OBX08150.1 ABC transporter permease [Gallibacterium salpingitidis]OBX11681.1 ABC transporter permease [Gallibacterium salpingitidis]WKT00092.1 ABC transporter permease subunit [Gallibacterium salpingitidis]